MQSPASVPPHTCPNGRRLTKFQSGWGDLPLQKLLSVQVAFLNMLSLWFSLSSCRSGRRAPC